MALRSVVHETALAGRAAAEKALARAVETAILSYLSDVKAAALSALPNSLVASSSPLPSGEFPSLGASAGRWAAEVDARVLAAVRVAFESAWSRYTDLGFTVTSPQHVAMEAYVARVRDRLVPGTHFGVPVYEESFEAVRLALADSVAGGWTRPELAQRIAADLSWETDGPYWRAQKAAADSAIDAVLDPLGPPGTPAREFARLNDAKVQALRLQRNLAVRRLDAERSVWQVRANLIARTEATGAYNAGAQEALVMEGVNKKMWLSTFGPRTRISHSDASGQAVPVRGSFLVGDSMLQYPGDPSGPAEEVSNCRCTMVGGDDI